MSSQLLPLYKYLDVNGALLTLTNRTFRHAKPCEYEDEEDMTVQKVFPEEELESLTIIKNNLTKVILKNIDRPPTCISPILNVNIVRLQKVYRNNPYAVYSIKKAMQNERVEDIYDIKRLRVIIKETLRQVNEHMQQYRVLCLTKNRDSERIWERYGEEHKGIVLRVIPNLKKDSKFRLLKEVQYKDYRPTLYNSTIEFIEALFEDPAIQNNKNINSIIYTKTKKWNYECEYRLAIPHFKHENWNTLPYHSDEIQEMYIGLNTSNENKEKFISLAQAINPNIKIFQTIRNKEKLNFINAQ